MSIYKLFTGTKLPWTFSRENSLAFQQAYEKTANSLQPPNKSLQNEKMVETA